MKDKLLEVIEKPTTIDELKNTLDINDASTFKLLIKSLNELEEEGYLVNVNEKFDIARNQRVYIGEIQINRKGFGFVETELDEDIYIPKGDLKNALHQDKVLVRVTKDRSHGFRPEGIVLRVLERRVNHLVGTYKAKRDVVFPDDGIFTKSIKLTKPHSANDNDKVLVKITDYYKSVCKGEIVEIIGNASDLGVDVLSIAYKYGFKDYFPTEVLDDLDYVSNTDYDRTDLREKNFITIDGADALDLDDAVCLETKGESLILSVSIADVSHYVKEGTNIDKEAKKRSTSVYLLNKVLPMLPKELSNGICSLNPHEDRLTLTCEMEIKDGVVVNHKLYESVINSKYRMTYSDVNKILNGDKQLQTEYAEIVSMLYNMNRLAKQLTERRKARGAINFETNEPKIIVDDLGRPTDILSRDRQDSEKLIEEFMLLANETVAEHFHWLGYPFIYRVHEEPNQEKLTSLIKLAGMLGLKIRRSKSIHPSALQELLESVEDLPSARIINTLMVRSMAKARYDINSLGHYGLATNFYTHFTSPIRRYPDLIVHRLIKELVINNNVDKIEHFEKVLPEIANITSKQERAAVNAERDVDAMKIAEYMQDKVGKTFKGVVSSITSFGMFVEIDKFIEGLVHINDMKDDYYEYHQDRYILVGRRRKRVYTIGTEVIVRCINANKKEAKIDFEIAGGNNGKNRRPKQKSKT